MTEGVLTTQIGFQVVLRDIQKCISDETLPTPGLVFDADHAGVLIRSDIFICRDANFAESLKTLAKFVEQKTQGFWKPTVVTNAKQLRSAIKKGHERLTSTLN